MDYSKFDKSALTLSILLAITILMACILPRVATATLQPNQTSIPTPAVTPGQAQASTAAHWKMYQNKTYGFTFEYPAIYDEPAYRDSCGLKENSEGIRLGLRSSLRISDSGGLSLEEYANNLLTGRDWSVDAPKNGTISGLQALTLEYRFGGTNRYGTFTLVKRADLIFIFEFTAGGFCDIPEAQVTEPEAYSHMLESFRFDSLTANGASASPAP